MDRIDSGLLRQAACANRCEEEGLHVGLRMWRDSCDVCSRSFGAGDGFTCRSDGDSSSGIRQHVTGQSQAPKASQLA